ncbi:MAG: hypothetical protein ACLQVD_09435 [Capsulimonadaceae bacterium]
MRLTQVISPGNRPSAVSAGTHMASGFDHGRIYGCAFDIAVVAPDRSADRDVRALRLQGIAAWRRGPDAPGGAPGLAPHIHCVWPGASSHNIQNAQQIASFVRGYRGLVGIGVPRTRWIGPSIRPDERRRVRELYDSVHGSNSLRSITPYELLHSAR